MDERSEAVERRLEGPLLVAALLTVPAIAIEQSGLAEPWDTLAVVLNWTIWTAFLAEVVIMLRIVPNRRRWLRDHPLDVAIVLLTPPFLPASLQAARVFRLLRLLRLARAAGLARRLYSTEGVRDAAVLALMTVLGGGAAFAALERGHHDTDPSAWDGVWWALTTVTTVGYGDLSPETDGGRVVAIVVMLVGIGFVAILTAAAAERFTASRREGAEERQEIAAKLDAIAARLDALERR
ncbi:MAG TPA: potassium channel family protein [Solirubrobacteraceae bacterium]